MLQREHQHHWCQNPTEKNNSCNRGDIRPGQRCLNPVPLTAKEALKPHVYQETSAASDIKQGSEGDRVNLCEKYLGCGR
ncbi:hypothetical protein MKMG_02254 [Methanogenium sp. MK-MG]|nr:hypothetical protein MKMG_02254 [Methanogenium sp. MK-MG]